MKSFSIAQLFATLLLIWMSCGMVSNARKAPSVCDKICDCDQQQGEIDCDNQALGTVGIDPVIDAEKVKVLSLRSNQIVRIQRQQILLGKGSQLTRLDVSNNLISRIDDNAFDTTPALEGLDLRNNKLTNLSEDTFAGLSNLLDLRLDHNLIEDLSTGSFFDTMPRLRILSIDSTPVKLVSNDTFVGLDNLQELSIDHAELSILPAGTFKPLARLEILSLRHNRFVVVPQEALQYLSQLKNLDLSGNPIVTINSNSFRHNTRLNVLAFVNMPALTYIEDCAFCNLHELRTLQVLNNSKLTDIDPEAFGRDLSYFQSLETVDFVNNSLANLDEDTLLWGDISSMIRLGGNPWKCDCEILWMTNDSLKIDKSDPPVCASPSRLKGKSVLLLEQFDAGLCIRTRLTGRVRAAKLFLVAAVLIIIFGAITTAWYIYNNRRKNGFKLRNLFYKPQLPKYAYRNLAMGEEGDQDVVVSNDGAAILPRNSQKPTRDLASSLADDT